LGENNSFSISSVADKHIGKRRKSVLEWATDGQMLYSFCSLVFQILAEINNSQVFVHVRVGNISDPSWNGSRE
jgi:hypothetical protein